MQKVAELVSVTAGKEFSQVFHHHAYQTSFVYSNSRNISKICLSYLEPIK
jgi:hypothetical protein